MRNEENIHLTRRVVHEFGKLRVVMWIARGKAFTGQACHMKALKYARQA